MLDTQSFTIGEGGPITPTISDPEPVPWTAIMIGAVVIVAIIGVVVVVLSKKKAVPA